MPLSYRPTARRAIHVRSRPDCPEIAQNRRARPCGPFDIGCFSIRSCAQLSMGTCRGTNFAMYHMPLASSSAMDSLEIGRASCRERVLQYVSISVVVLSLKKKNKKTE